MAFLYSRANPTHTLLRVAARSLSSKSSAASPCQLRYFSNASSQTRFQTIPYQRRSSSRPNIASSRNAVVSAVVSGQCRTFFGPAIIRDYVDLPKEYKDRTGLAFRNKDLTEEEVNRIFGGEAISAASANHLLRVLHGRRVAGTLDDPAFAVHTMQYTESQISKALEFLRKSVKVDEVMNAGLRAEDELSQLDLDPVEESTTEDGKPAATEGKDEAGENDESAEPKIEIDPVYGRSSFDAIRARNQAKNAAREKAREKALEEERAKAEAEGHLVDVLDDPQARSLVEVEDGQRAITNPKIAEYYKQASSEEKEPPKLSYRERVGPSLAIFSLVMGFLVSLTMVYNEPAARYRLIPEVSPGVATVGAIIALNVGVFALWRIPPLWKFLNNYAIFVVGKPRALTLFTANFSHQEFKHLAINMVILGLAGVHLHEDLGRMGFLTMFLGCGAAGFLSGLAVYTARGMLGITSLGASGAVIGVLSGYYWDHRDDRFKVFGLPQDGVHGVVWWALLVGYTVFEAFSTFALKNRTDVVGHIAGLISGMLGIELMNKLGLGRNKPAAEEKKDSEKVIIKDLASGEQQQGLKDEKKQ